MQDKQLHSHTVHTGFGLFTLIQQGDTLTNLFFAQKEAVGTQFAETPLLKEAQAQLTAYFAGRLQRFDLPLAPKGTPFQLACWAALCSIPYGEVRTYSQQAQMAGRPTAARAVGMANHRNPLPILIPCHRVIGANGRLTGYAGGLQLKQQLLELEQRNGFEQANQVTLVKE